jgi:formate dehydrogenase subunit gamma
MRDRKGRDRADSGGSTRPVAPPEVTEAVRQAMERHQGERGPLIEMLHDVQATLGCIPAPAIPLLAYELNISPADVFGVVTFYKDFREQPAGRRTVRICRAEACQSLGSEQLVDRATTALGIELGATTSDGATTLDQVFCFGNCALGPSVEVDGQLFGRVDTTRLDAMLAAGAGS